MWLYNRHMVITRPSERADLAVAAKLFRGLADPMRLAIVELLANGEMRVTDIVAALGTSQSNVSAHLACLKECGLVEDRPQGRAVLYRLARPELFDVLKTAEVLLDAVGHRIELCSNFEDRR